LYADAVRHPGAVVVALHYAPSALAAVVYARRLFAIAVNTFSQVFVLKQFHFVWGQVDLH
jgi:hypothetical protein